MPHWISIVAIALLLTSLVYIVTSKLFSFNWLFFLPIAAILLPYIVGLAWSHNISQGLSTVQVRLMLLALPLAFSFTALQPTAKQQETAFSIFSMASLVLVIGTNLLILIKGFTHPVGFAGADFTFSYRVSLEHYSGLHPTYYSAIIYTAAFVQLYKFLKKELTKRWEYVLSIATIIICTMGGVAAASRATLIAYFIIVFVFVVLHIKNHPRFWWFVAALIATCLLLFYSPLVQNRLQEINTANLEAPVGNNDNGTNVRSGIFKCDIQLLKQYWLWGVGTGNIQHELNSCLGQYDTNVYDNFNYNTHNEYINIWLTAGLLGLAVWFFCMGYPIYKSIQQRQWLHLYFLVFICLCFLTENYLDRQMGVTFFAFMQTLFFFKTVKPQ